MRGLADFLYNLRKHGLKYFNRYYSFYDAVVTDNNDPEKLGRVKFSCQELELNPDYFAFPRGNWNGKNNSGVFAPPTVGAHIEVSFKYGDIQYPYYSMAYAYKGDYPEQGVQDYLSKFGFVTPEGIEVVCNDKDNSVLISLSDGETVLHITSSGISLGSKDKSIEPLVLGDKNKDVLNEVQSILSSFSTSLITYANTQSGVTTATQILSPLTVALQNLSTSIASKTTDIAELSLNIEKTVSTKNTTE